MTPLEETKVARKVLDGMVKSAWYTLSEFQRIDPRASLSVLRYCVRHRLMKSTRYVFYGKEGERIWQRNEKRYRALVGALPTMRELVHAERSGTSKWDLWDCTFRGTDGKVYSAHLTNEAYQKQLLDEKLHKEYKVPEDLLKLYTQVVREEIQRNLAEGAAGEGL